MNIQVKKRNGRLEDFKVEKINKCAERACEELDGVSASEVILDAQIGLFNKITTQEIDSSLVFSARQKIEKEPNYSFAAARLLLNSLYKEVFREGVDSDIFKLQYRKSFVQGIKKLVKSGKLNKRMLEYDLKKLSESLKIRRDLSFKYLGIFKSVINSSIPYIKSSILITFPLSLGKQSSANSQFHTGLIYIFNYVHILTLI